jgi:hypothetical protein
MHSVRLFGIVTMKPSVQRACPNNSGKNTKISSKRSFLLGNILFHFMRRVYYAMKTNEKGWYTCKKNEYSDIVTLKFTYNHYNKNRHQMKEGGISKWWKLI